MGILRKLLGQDKAQPPVKKPARRLHRHYTLEEMTTEKVCALLRLREIKGPMAALIHGRKVVCNWASKVGEGGLEDLRDLILRDLKSIEGIYLVE